MSSLPAWWPFPAPEDMHADGLWLSLKSELDVQAYLPVRAEGVVSKELTDGSGRHYMLKNAAAHSYARLSPEEFWIWEQMDGEKTVRQLVVAYFTQYKAFAFGAIQSLLERLREAHMLTDPPRHLYADVAAAIQTQSPVRRFTGLARSIFTREFVVKNLDLHLDRIHRHGGWILFTWPAQVLFLLVSVIGLYLFVILARDPQYNLLNLDTAIQLGLIAYIPLVIHEFGHAITAKHVGCEVYKGGVMLYYGMPAAFVDTTDLWMFGKRARLAVTWAGPYTGYIIGGACSIIVYLFPGIPHTAAVLLLQAALVGIFTTTMNILPLLKLDGYYLLSDSLEIPRLRERSMEFILHQLRTKVTKREVWTREEKIFLVFGALALLSTVYFTYAGITFWDWQTTSSISGVLSPNGSLGEQLQNIFTFLLAASAILYSLALLTGSARQAYRWLQAKGVLSTRARAALILLIVAVALTLLPRLLLPTLGPWFLLLSGIGVYALISWLSLSDFLSMRGSIHAWMWIPLSSAALLGAAGFLDRLNLIWGPPALLTVLARLAASLLIVASALLAGRLLSGLRGSWRGLSPAFIFFGAALLALSAMAPHPMELDTLASLLLLAGLLHWNMRPASQIQPGAFEAAGSARERLVAAFHEMRVTIRSELELDFGILSRKRLEDGAYRPQRGVGEADFARSATGMTPNDYGGALALQLNELLTSVERLGGKKYAWRSLAYGYDRLHWDLQEIVEDYILKYVTYAAGLSHQLSEDRDDIGLLLRSVPLFASMSPVMLRALRQQFQMRSLRAGDEIVHAGAPDNSFFLVRAGRLEVVGTVDIAGGLYKPMHANLENDQAMFFLKKPRRITQLTRGDYFGELALLEGQPHEATVRALTPAQVLWLSRADFDRLLRSSLSFGDSAREQMRWLGILRQIPLFEGLDVALLQSIAGKLERLRLQAGDPVFRQGDPAGSFYIIERGKAGVLIDGEQRASLGTGEYFGEIALLTNTPRTASVVALQPLSLLQLRADTFYELIQDSGLKHAIERTSSRRVLENERWARQRQTDLAR